MRVTIGRIVRYVEPWTPGEESPSTGLEWPAIIAVVHNDTTVSLQVWRATGGDRHRWPWAPLGLLAIWIGDWTGTLYAFLDELAQRIDRWNAPGSLYRWGQTVWPSCPFCGCALLTSYERHRCR
jgi:hypothetical protein